MQTLSPHTGKGLRSGSGQLMGRSNSAAHAGDNGSTGDQTALRQRPAGGADANIVAARGRGPASGRAQLTDRRNGAAPGGGTTRCGVQVAAAGATDAR
jgi:hypothetical protein